jgi:diguanylate cyclase (GGDEF)-like protein
MPLGSDPVDPSRHAASSATSHPPLSVEQTLEKGLDLLRRIRDSGEDAVRAELQCELALGFLTLDLHQDALVHALEAIGAAQGSGAELLLCRATCTMGLAQAALGWHDEAQRTLLDALRMARVLQSHDQMRDALLGLSALALPASKPHAQGADASTSREAIDQARGYAEQALAIVRKPGRPPSPGMVLCELGRCLAECGRIEAAQAVLGDAHSQAVRHGDALLKLRADAGLAEIMLQRGEFESVAALAAELLAGARELQDNGVHARAEHLLYESHKALEDLPRALAHLERYLVIRQDQRATLHALQARLTMKRVEHELARARAVRRRAMAVPAQDPWQTTSTLAMLDERRTELSAAQDPVTGLGNRRHIERELPRLLALSERRKSTLSVALIELDHFRTVTERFGRPVRDMVLKVIADILHAHTRSADLVARTAPQEFVYVLCDASRDGARDACERLRLAVQNHPWESIAPSLVITASIGLCEQGHKLNAAQLLARADRALYFARSRGRNRVVLADDTM